MRTAPPRLFALAALLALAGCRTTTRSIPAGLDRGEPREALAVEAWEAVAGGRAIGVVVRFEPAGRPEERWFSVRNVHQQELGLVDARGRAWRFRPADGEAEWVGTGTVGEGVARILAPAGGLALYEVPLATLAAEAGAPVTGAAPE